VSEAPVRPRFELEPQPIARLEPEAPLAPVPLASQASAGGVGLAASGVALLVAGFAALQAGNFVAAQFERGPILGWLTLAVALAGFGLLGIGAWRELRGLFGLRHVDRLRAALGDPARATAAALEWLADLPEGAALAGAVRAANDPDAVLALLRAGPVATLRARADQLGRVAALQVFTVAAAVPSPALDGLLVGWRGVRLVRQIAALHGLRPGLFGTLSLLRRVAFTAATVVATDFAADVVMRSLIATPLLERLASDVNGAGLAARRMIVLARATTTACTPLPPG
jgi:putative membrane protein